MIYSNFNDLSKDQERLISTNAFNYVEGFIFTDEISITSLRPAFNTTSDESKIISLLHKQGLLYCIELVKYYDDQSAGTIDQVRKFEVFFGDVKRTLIQSMLMN